MGHGSSVQTKPEEKNNQLQVKLIKFGEFKELHSIIRLINFKKFKALKGLPRYPENADLTLTLDQLSEEEYSRSLIVFVSHCWLRGWSGAKGWDGRPHPDDPQGSKYDLCVRGIEYIMKGLAPGMEECYIWLDFGCIDQNGNPAGELKLLDKIVQVSDCIVTPIVDENHSSWKYNKVSNNYFHEYQSSSWIGQESSYLSRGWCRVEMFYAANIPVLEDSEERRNRMTAGLKLQRGQGRRPHILYGTKEKAHYWLPLVLPPLQNSYFFEFHPEKGHLSKEQDRETIKELVKGLGAYMNVENVESYVGKYDKQMHKEGKGVRVYDNGDRYEGQFKNDLRHGYGIYTSANGDVYEGEYRNGKKHGKSVFRNSVGDIHEGQYYDGLKTGYGIHKYIDGGRYEGKYLHDYRHGKGIYIYPKGDRLERYEGDWYAGEKGGGRGIMKFSNGDVYDGEYKANLPNGSGTLTKANGDVYQGEFVQEQMTGKGVYSYAHGDVYEGEMKDGKKHGRGKLVKKTGEIVEGEWRDDAVV